MRCLKEKEIQAWLDGEISQADAARLGAHAGLCPRCSERAGAMEERNRFVLECLSALNQVDEPAPSLPFIPRKGPPRSGWKAGVPPWRFRVPAHARVSLAAACVLLAFFLGRWSAGTQFAPRVRAVQAPLSSAVGPPSSPARVSPRETGPFTVQADPRQCRLLKELRVFVVKEVSDGRELE